MYPIGWVDDLRVAQLAGRGLRSVTHASPRIGGPVIILGIILLLLGFFLHVSILWTIGIIVLVVGLVLLLLGSMGRAVGGRRHYY
jgi:uncharacterized protein DUF6131